MDTKKVENVQKVKFTKKDVHEIGDGFFAVETEEGYVIVFCEQVVSEKTFETIEKAKAYKNSKPWSMILICASIYYDRIKSISKND